MNAYEEFSTAGALGPAGVELLYETVSWIARSGNYRPPAGHGRWDPDAVVSTAHEFLTGPRGLDRITALFELATGPQSFERLLQTAVRNHLRSEARKTERAKLLRRLNEVLTSSNRFVEVGGRSVQERRWALRGFEDAPEYVGAPSILIEAAWRAPNVRLARWRSDRTFIAERESIEEFAAAVLAAAQSPVLLETVAEVAAERFSLSEPPILVDIADIDVAEPDADPGDSIKEPSAGLQVWAQLTPQERRVLPYLDASVREAGLALGIGKTKAAGLIRAVKAVIRTTIPDDANAEDTLRLLLELEQEVRTSRGDRAF